MKRVRSEAYRLRNLERGRERYLENKEKLDKAHREYFKAKALTIEGRQKRLLNGAQSRSKEKNLPYDLDLEYLGKMWEEQDGRCSISGFKFDLEAAPTKRNKHAPSLDKIIPELGYVKGNVRLVCWHVNVAIAEYGLESFLELCNQVNTNYNKEQSVKETT